MLPEDIEPRLVMTVADETRLVLGRLASSAHVVQDLRDGRRIPIIGDFMPFVVAVDGAPHLSLAGAGSPFWRRVEIAYFDCVETLRIRDGVWMTFPVPFTEPTAIAVTWHADEEADVQRVTSPVFTPDTLAPVWGDSWTWYADTSVLPPRDGG